MNRRLRITLLAAPLLCAIVIFAVTLPRPVLDEAVCSTALDDVIVPDIVTVTLAGPPDAEGNVRLLVHLPLAELEGPVQLDYRLPQNVAVQKMPGQTTGTAASLRGTTQELVVRPMDDAPAPVFVTVTVGGLHVTASAVLNPPPPEPDRGAVRTTADGRRLHLYPAEARP